MGQHCYKGNQFLIDADKKPSVAGNTIPFWIDLFETLNVILEIASINKKMEVGKSFLFWEILF